MQKYLIHTDVVVGRWWKRRTLRAGAVVNLEGAKDIAIKVIDPNYRGVVISPTK